MNCNTTHYRANSSSVPGDPTRTYTIGMENARLYRGEADSARQLAARLGTEHHEVMLSEEKLLRHASTVIAQLDEPVADPVSIPIYFVTQLARETGTVVLHAGEGADELFCGYDSYRRFLRQGAQMWAPLNRLPRFVPWLGFRALRLGRSPRCRKVADALRRLALGQEFFMSSAVAYYEDEKAQVLAAEFRNTHRRLDSFDVVAPLYRRVTERAPNATLLQKMTAVELQLRLPELLLMRVDKMAMAHGVEVRVPFLDRDLIDFALAVPESFKLRDGVSKEPLKRLLARRLNRETAYKPKTGFGVPIQEWFRGELGSHLRALIHEHRDVYAGWFDLAWIERRLDGGIPTVNTAFQLWVLYNFILWWEGLRRGATELVACGAA